MSLRHILLAITLGATAAAAAWAATPGSVDALRGPVPVTETTQPPRLANAVNDDVRRPRGWEKQPPTIPHRVDGYQIDRNFNKCLDCHSRERSDFTQAIPVSATHYINRAGEKLPQISTRRYFCMQCHVPQEAAPALVGNTYGRAAPAPAAPAATAKRAAPSHSTKQSH